MAESKQHSSTGVGENEEFEDAQAAVDSSNHTIDITSNEKHTHPQINGHPIPEENEHKAQHGSTDINQAMLDPTLVSKSLDEQIKNPESAEKSQQYSSKSRSGSIDQAEVAPKPPPKTSRFGAFSASLPSVPWSSAAAARRPSNVRREPSPQPPPQPPPTTRRTTPFGWLSRATSAGANPKSPPLPPRAHSELRRNTCNSIATLGSNPELMLRALEETQDGKSGEKGPARQLLRDRFKELRLQEEVGITLDGVEIASGSGATGMVSRSASVGTSLASPISISENQDDHFPAVPETGGNPTRSKTAPVTSTSNEEPVTPIDWDFWQTVVNEGPQAVARSSPEELNAAIAGGIPQTIRGVIWQVLASSKNEDLEAVYHDLRIQGTKEAPRDIYKTASITSNLPNGSIKEQQESVSSSKSSVHSDHSTPATTAPGLASPSPSIETSDPLQHPKLPPQPRLDAAAITKLEKAIKRDMGPRTSFAKYSIAAGFQDGLFNVCRAYALFDEAVGYPQGMNFIIMPMLFNMSEEEAFCLLVRMMHKYRLRDLFTQDMPGLHLHLYQFERLLEDLEPALFCHLNRRGANPRLYATQWFLTLFAYRFPLQLVMRVFDLVLCEGLEGAILKFGMALIQRNVQTLLAMNDMAALATFLKAKLFDAYIDSAPTSKSILESGFFGSSGGSDNEVYRADLLVQDACAIKLTPEMLAMYTAEWEEKTRTEKSRETELDNLRTDTATKAAQIRSLEKRAEKSDSEHIEIANELVKLKVENQDLIDQNESLKGQVEELRKVAASEALNVEERMRESTEQVMQKNIQVQNENRHMEEQMAEMERELVAIKMKYAELNGEHDGLRQRWSDLKKALE